MFRIFNKNKSIFKQSLRMFSSLEKMEYDVCIVGGGIAGLSTSIKLKQLNQDINVCVVEKGSEIGSHILSGNVFMADSLNLLFKDWQTMDNPPPITQQVEDESFIINISQSKSIKIPKWMLKGKINNQGNYIISLAELCIWLGNQAEELGVDVITGFSCDKLNYDKDNKVNGVITKPFGINKQNQKTENYQDPILIEAPLTVLSEGARGSLTEKVIKNYNLRKHSDPPSYSLGLKEIWQVQEGTINAGYVEHGVGWPTPLDTYAGNFLYSKSNTEIHLGYIIGLDYKNPYLNPYEEFQLWKTSQHVSNILQNGQCIKYGARVISTGGYYSLPKLTFPGGILIGCSAGFLDVIKIKGSHNALKSGVIAAEAIAKQYEQGDLKFGKELKEYSRKIKQSDLFIDLKQSKDFKGGFKNGVLKGLFNGIPLNFGFSSGLFFKEMRNNQKDSETIQKSDKFEPIQYPKHDGKITFDILESVSRSDTHHDHDQPSHLVVKEGGEQSWQKSLEQYAGFEQRYCPAKVYEFVENENGKKQLQINAQNCVHCKTCSIKALDEYIQWEVPQGGDGPEQQFKKQKNVSNNLNLKLNQYLQNYYIMEIEPQYQEYSELLKDTGASWRKHIEVVNKLLEDIQAGNEESLDFVIQNPKIFGDLLYNLRSNFVNQLCNMIIFTLKQEHPGLQNFAESILLNPSMNKCLQSGNKVILQFSQLCFQTFFQQNLVDYKHLVQLIENNRQQKSYQIRAEIAKGVSVYIKKKLDDNIEVSKDEKHFLDETLKMFLGDKTPQVRKAIKKGEDYFDQLIEGKKSSNNLDKQSENKMNGNDKSRSNSLNNNDSGNISNDPGVQMLDKLSQFQTNSLEKKRLLGKFQKQNFHSQPNLELMKKALEINQNNKKMDIQKLIESILFLMNINSFAKELLTYLSEKKLNENLVYKKFLKRVTKIDLTTFVEVFNQQVNYTAFSLLNKKATSSTMKNLKKSNRQLFDELVVNLEKLKNDDSLDPKEQEKTTKFLAIITKDDKKPQDTNKQDFNKKTSQNITDAKKTIQNQELKTNKANTKVMDSIFNNSDQNLKITYLMDLKDKSIQVTEQNYLIVIDELLKQSHEVEISFQHDIKILEQILNEILQYSNELTKIFIPYFHLLENEDNIDFETFMQFFKKVQSQKEFFNIMITYKNLSKKILENIFNLFQQNKEDEYMTLMLSLLLSEFSSENDIIKRIILDQFDTNKQIIQDNLMNNKILIRKETVLICVNLQKFLAEEQFKEFIQQIKPEYQELINYYSKGMNQFQFSYLNL